MGPPLHAAVLCCIICTWHQWSETPLCMPSTPVLLREASRKQPCCYVQVHLCVLHCTLLCFVASYALGNSARKTQCACPQHSGRSVRQAQETAVLGCASKLWVSHCMLLCCVVPWTYGNSAQKTQCACPQHLGRSVRQAQETALDVYASTNSCLARCLTRT